MAGWDKELGGTVYNIPLGGGLFKGPWAIGGESSFAQDSYESAWGSRRWILEPLAHLFLCRIRFYLHLWLLRCYFPRRLGTR